MVGRSFLGVESEDFPRGVFEGVRSCWMNWRDVGFWVDESNGAVMIYLAMGLGG